MMYSVIGILVIITLIAVRLLQTSGGGIKTLWTRWQKTTATATPTGTVMVAPKKPLPWMKIIGGAILTALFVHFYTGHGFLGLGGYSKTNAYGWNLIETITCPMGKESWENGRGWCTSQTRLEPGTYRLLFKEVRWEVAFWDPVSKQVAQYRQVPVQGIPLDEWQNNPSFMRTFLKDAPVGGNRRLGSVVAKIEGQEAFDPLQERSFDISRTATISIGPNIPFCDTSFVHNRGVIIVEIEKEME